MLHEPGLRYSLLPGRRKRSVSTWKMAWRNIWRLSRTRRKISWRQQLIILKVELTPGLRPRYKRSLMTLPAIDGWIARKFGLRIPIQNLDADETTILASIERFRPVQRVTP